MPNHIQLLPDSIANQIAAGEVIQRPASVVKELLENAIDAGATSIQLIFEQAGKRLIQVIDNGKGMNEVDARMSFERHATSKIREVQDIFAIKTMGFRGEALASIAAISQVHLKTRMADQETGTELKISGSTVEDQQACASPEGSSIAVKNLFFNVPARRKFLKSDAAETRHILEEFQRVALSHPDIHFVTHHNGNELFHLKQGNHKQRIVQLFGKNYKERLVPLEENTDSVNISGFIGKPEFARKTRGEQYFFVNNRYIKSPYLNHAVTSAFQDHLSSDSYPLYVIFLEIDPGRIDINVHPTKQEIKFDDERLVYTFLNAAVKRALSVYSVTPAIDFTREISLDFESSWKNSSEVQLQNAPPKPIAYPRMPEKDPQLGNWQKVFEPEHEKEEVTMGSALNNDVLATQLEAEVPEFQAIQIHKTYILYPIKSGLILVDQQAAHERILFERFIIAMKNRDAAVQQLMFAETIELKQDEALMLNEILPEVKALGYEIEAFGKNSFIIRGEPAGLPQVKSHQQIFENVLELCKVNSPRAAEGIQQVLASALATKMATPRGTVLGAEEMKALVDQLFACETPYIAPGGRLTFVTWSSDEMARQFAKKN